MKRSEIKVGDDLAYQRGSYSSPEQVRVVAVDGFHLRPRDSYLYGRREPREFPLADGSTLNDSRVRRAGQFDPANCIIVRPVAEDGTLLNPRPVRSQTLIGPWAEVKAERDAAAEASAKARREAERREAKNLAQGKAVLARLAALGIEPKSYISDHDLEKGRFTITIEELARVLDLIPASR